MMTCMIDAMNNNDDYNSKLIDIYNRQSSSDSESAIELVYYVVVVDE